MGARVARPARRRAGEEDAAVSTVASADAATAATELADAVLAPSWPPTHLGSGPGFDTDFTASALGVGATFGRTPIVLEPEDDGSGVWLWAGLGVGASVLVLAGAGAAAVAAVALSTPPPPGQVDMTVSF